MSHGQMFGLAFALFVVPIAFVFCWKFDELVMGMDPDAVPQGTLIYFYAER